jgi:hypothetical protein
MIKLESASKNQPREVSLAFGTPLGVGTCHGHLDTQDSPRPELESKPPPYSPYSILYASPRRRHPNGTKSRESRNGVPKLSRNCPEIVPAGLPELWTAITPDCGVGSRWGLNQSCSPRRGLSNAMSHSQIGHREEVDSWLLVVGSQTANLTLGPSFAHNLGCRCPNDQCEAILDIYVSRPFQWHQEHPKARCFAPCCWALNIRESRRTPNPHFFQVLGFTPTLGQSRVATLKVMSKTLMQRMLGSKSWKIKLNRKN